MDEENVIDNSKLDVYFYQLAKDTGTIVCVSSDQSLVEDKLNGKVVFTRKQNPRVFGLLCLCESTEDGVVSISGASLGLKPNAKLSPAFRFSNTPVLQRGDDPDTGILDGEPTGMFWVESSKA